MTSRKLQRKQHNQPSKQHREFAPKSLPLDDASMLEQREFGLMYSASSSYSGPLPEASELAKYEAAIPGSGEKIIEFMMLEQKHRHEVTRQDQVLQEKQIDYHNSATRRSQIFILISIFLICLLCAYALYKDQSKSSYIIFSASVGLVSLFLLKNFFFQRGNEQESKSDKKEK